MPTEPAAGLLCCLMETYRRCRRSLHAWVPELCWEGRGAPTIVHAWCEPDHLYILILPEPEVPGPRVPAGDRDITVATASARRLRSASDMARPETEWTTPSEQPAGDGPELPSGIEIPAPELDEELIVAAEDTGKTAGPPAETVSGSVPDPDVEAEDIGRRRRDRLRRKP